MMPHLEIKRTVMKKLMAFIICLLMGMSIWAQKRGSFSIFTGYGAYTIHGKYPGGEKFTLRPEESIVIATDYEFPIAPKVYLQPGIQFLFCFLGIYVDSK